MKNQRKVVSLMLVTFLLMVLMVGSVFAISAYDMPNAKKLNSDNVVIHKVVSLNDGVDPSVTDVSVTASSVSETEIGNSADVSSGTSGGEYGTTTPYFEVEISPSDQVTRNGVATYTILFKEPHEDLCKGKDICPTPRQEYTYKLRFQAGEGGESEGEFSEASFTIGSGQTKKITLTVKTETKGTSSFVVYAEGLDYTGMGVGTITYIPGLGSASFFIGKGFIVNDEESKGYLVDLKILKKDNVLSGKATIGHRTFKIDGEVVPSLSNSIGTKIKFDLIRLPVTSSKPVEIIGKFEGNVKQYGNFKVLEGEVTYLSLTNDLNEFGVGVWKLTAFGKKQGIVNPTPIEPGERPVPLPVIIDDVLVVEQPSDSAVSKSATVSGSAGVGGSSTGFYVRPVEISKRKILGILPWGPVTVKVQVIKGDQIIEKTISENSEAEVEGYAISVGSLDEETQTAEISVQ